MIENQIDLKSIQDLRGMKFFIPDYQRGYRWTKQQVDDLLDDIWEFMNNGNGGWYSLQPVVVKKRGPKGEIKSFKEELEGILKIDNDTDVIKKTSELLNSFEDWKDWEVVDGQQRLTSLFIVLKYLDKDNDLFSIEYETRNVEDGNSSEFLNNITAKTESKASDNIDYYHMLHTYKAVEKWFGEGGKNLTNESKDEFMKTILNKVQVIWYEITENAIEVFTRINSGKIPLTNAELIKALFLNSSNFNDADSKNLRLKQLEISSEWDRIEYSLQDDSFWLFLNKDNDDLPTRIEFIFHLMYQLEKDDLVDKSKREDFDKVHGNDNYSTFRFFNHKFNGNSKGEYTEKIVTDTWVKIKKCYQTLQEWYENRELYHKVGYLITMGVDIIKIVKEWEGKTKEQFKQWLNQRIYSFVKDLDLDKLEYRHGENVRKVLLLHNIQTLLQNENESTLFPFDRFKNEKWDIEHIHANATEVRVSKDELKEWLEKNFVETNDEQRDEKMDELIQLILDEKPYEEDSISDIITYVLGGEDNSLGNLCLLDSKTNRSYKNDGFKVKRKEIIKREKAGTFIPICTRNLFMKYYSDEVKSLELWSESDRSAYLKDIEDKLKHYLPEKNQKKYEK